VSAFVGLVLIVVGVLAMWWPAGLVVAGAVLFVAHDPAGLVGLLRDLRRPGGDV